MASKQLGKLRQWGREVISSKEKTVLTQEFKELEQDIDLRRIGVERLHGACAEYHAYLQKKKEYSSIEEGVKMLPVDALGVVMMSHGEEFGDDSAFGQCLFKLGRAHCKIATLQETYALTFRDTYLASLEDTMDELNDYAIQRKKLDSRRLAYDAAVTKATKVKKEKEVKEAEEELSKAKLRYEETSTDVQVRMHAIQEKEIHQLRDLGEFLGTEVRFVEKYLDVLRNTHDEWLDESAIQQSEMPRRKAIPHTFASGRSTPSISSTSKTTTSARRSSASIATSPSEEDEGDDYRSGRGNIKSYTSPANTTRPSSRASTTSVGTAHTSRRRKDSAGSDGGASTSASTGKRMSVAGWASSAVSSLSGSGRGKKEVKKDKGLVKERDKGAMRAFASLENAGEDSEDDEERPANEFGAVKDDGRRFFGSSSLSKVLSQTPPMAIRQLGNPLNSGSSNSSFNSLSGSGSSAPSASRKVMRALFDFSGSSDELNFRTGDEIVVLSVGQGGWSTGEVAGRRGLFPTNYAEEVPALYSRVTSPPLPSRMTEIAQRAQNDTMSADSASVASVDLHGVGAQIRLYDEPFGDHHLAKSPMVIDHEHDPSGDTLITEDEDDERALFARSESVGVPPAQPTDDGIEVGNVAGNVIGNVRQPPALPQRRPSTKKPPPPPPARRSTVNVSASPSQTQTVSSGGPYTSAPSSTANLASLSFPPPPAAPRRSNARSHSSNAIGQTTLSTMSVSPFDN